MARIYANENFPLPVVLALRELGHDVLTVAEAGRANQKIPDDQVLAAALADGRAVLTLNRRDYIRLHKLAPAHLGIIVCTRDHDFAGQAARIHEALIGVVDLQGHLLRVTKPPQATK